MERNGRRLTAVEKVNARETVTRMVLREIVVDLALGRPNAPAYLADLFERISARMDVLSPNEEAEPIPSAMRAELEKFFVRTGERMDEEARRRASRRSRR